MSRERLAAATLGMSYVQKAGALDYLTGVIGSIGSADAESFLNACDHGKRTYPPSPKEDTQRILDNAAEISRIADSIRDGSYVDDEPPSRPGSEAEEWDRNTASNEAYLNRERHR